MKHYLLSIQQPDGPPPPELDIDRIMREVNVLDQEMKDAGVWVFNGPLTPPSTATVVRASGDELLITDGPYAEGKEHVGGLVIIMVPDLDAALDWASRMARVITLPIEVRPFRGDGH